MLMSHIKAAPPAETPAPRSGGRRLWISCGLTLTGLLVPCLPALAWSVGDVDVGGVHILTVRAPEAGMSVKQRADKITDRLRFILSEPVIRPHDIRAVPLPNDSAKIRVKNRLLVMVTPEDARRSSRNKMTALELAGAWTRHLRRVLPQLNAKPNPNDVHWAKTHPIRRTPHHNRTRRHR
jgi:hypothetical protein